MRAVVITEFGGPEVLEVQEVPDPEPAAGEVLVDVAATAINRADILQRQGNYKVPEGASPYPGLECSGTIAALGAGVTGWQVGDEVCALLTGGGYAERVAVPAGQLLPVPQGLSLIEAAALPETACTVWSMVFDIGRLQPGETFLVHGGSSGIGTLAIQLAHRHGARVFTTAGTQRKVDVCRQLGADVAINYREQDFVEVIKADSGGVDVILDNMGAVYLARNVDCPGGRRASRRAGPAGRAAGRTRPRHAAQQAGQRLGGDAARPSGRPEGRHRRGHGRVRLAVDRGRRGAAGDRPGAAPRRSRRGASLRRGQRAHRQGRPARALARRRASGVGDSAQVGEAAEFGRHRTAGLGVPDLEVDG